MLSRYNCCVLCMNCFNWVVTVLFDIIMDILMHGVLKGKCSWDWAPCLFFVRLHNSWKKKKKKTSMLLMIVINRVNEQFSEMDRQGSKFTSWIGTNIRVVCIVYGKGILSRYFLGVGIQHVTGLFKYYLLLYVFMLWGY